MSITAAMVKELRERTASGMMECKKALVEANGDMELAIENMRKAGLAKADKKSGRIAAEGLMGVKVSGDGKAVAMVDINCETDFVAKSEDFVAFVNNVTMALLNTPVNKNEEMLIIQGYLYRRILTMKNRSMISRNILFDTIFNQIKIDLKSKATGYEKVKLSRYRKYILEILDFWKINDFIKAFEYNKKGGVYYSITIDV